MDKREYTITNPFRDPMVPGERRAFMAEMHASNLNRLAMVALVVFVGEVLFCIARVGGVQMASVGKMALMVAYMVFFMVIKATGRSLSPAVGAANLLFVVGFLAFQYYLAVRELAASGLLYNFYAGLVVMTVAAFLNFWQSSVIIIAYTALVMQAILSTPQEQTYFVNNMVYTVIFMLVAIIGSRVYYNSKRDSFMSQARLAKTIEQLELLSTTDQLTSINNRRGFENEILIHWESCLRRQSPLAVLMIDIDKFKNYNDNYGHIAGDECLIAIAGCFNRVFHRKLDLYARFGGEEFVVAMPDISLQNAVELANCFREHISALGIAHAYSRVAPHITVSIGVASVVPQRMQTYEDFIRFADCALYAAKVAGGNRTEVWREADL